MIRSATRPLLIVIAVLILAGNVAVVRTAGITVPGSKVSETAAAVTPNALKPPECAALSLSSLVYGDGDFVGTAANDLALGGPAAQQIAGGDGDDCIVGGAGADDLLGDAGTDVCKGNPTTTFTDCETELP